jgi:ribose 5-phosphate isomerase B
MEKTVMQVGIAADHGGFGLQHEISESLLASSYEVVDLGAYTLNPDHDHPDFIIPMARAVAAGDVVRGIALCGSGA